MDETPAALFDSYEFDFRHILENIQDKLEGSGKDQQGEQRKATLRKVEIELDEADDIVSALEVEIQGIPQSLKSQYQARLKQAKTDLTRLKKLAKDVHTAHSRTELIRSRPGAVASDDPYSEQSDRDRLLAGTHILSDGSRRLTETQRIALEAEDQGADILRNLRVQRANIEHTRDTLLSADSNIDRSSSTIKKMSRLMHKQRFILSGIGIFFVLMILVILYFKIVR